MIAYEFEKKIVGTTYSGICTNTGRPLRKRTVVSGRQEAYIENYKGILEYTDSRILLLGKHCRLSIEGKHLMIPFYTAEEMKITGQIEHISYL
mgnify:CR=1 FL=1